MICYSSSDIHCLRPGIMLLIAIPRMLQVFHLKSHDAAKQLGVAQNALKRVCKRLGVMRWPQRKLASLYHLFEAAQNDANMSDADRKVSYQGDPTPHDDPCSSC